jgi:hypothetical protein
MNKEDIEKLSDDEIAQYVPKWLLEQIKSEENK